MRIPFLLAAGLSSLFLPAASAQVAELQKLVATPGAALQQFGFSVSIDGDRAIVGAPSELVGGFVAGAAYIFERDASGTWQLVQHLADGQQNISFPFGWVVAIDGDRAVVGAPGEYEGLLPDAGSAYVYERGASGTWSLVQRITAGPTPEATSRFGQAVAISGDRIVVGAPYSSRSGSAYQYIGEVHVYDRNPATGQWEHVQYLAGPTPPSTAPVDYRFGWSVAVAGDRLVAAAPYLGSGRCYVYEPIGSAPSPWFQTASFLSSSGVTGDLFGNSVGISGDHIVVGAPHDDDLGNDSGSAYVFDRGPGSAWSETNKLLATDGAPGDGFGYSVAIDADRVAVGSWQDDLGTGSVYVFEPNVSGWQQVHKIVASSGAAGEYLGSDVEVSDDRVLAGAQGDAALGAFTGAAYVFDVLPLSSATSAISAAAGGAQDMDVDAGAAVGGQLYLILGSATGTNPGTPLPGGGTLPLTFDGYTSATLSYPNTPPLEVSFGTLTAAGHGVGRFALPPNPALAGLVFYHAFVTFPASGFPATFISNPLSVTIDP